jgi:CRISPR/Cas system CMR subunit Cmr6 (Cas7 group RAMP superfamily)
MQRYYNMQYYRRMTSRRSKNFKALALRKVKSKKNCVEEAGRLYKSKINQQSSFCELYSQKPVKDYLHFFKNIKRANSSMDIKDSIVLGNLWFRGFEGICTLMVSIRFHRAFRTPIIKMDPMRLLRPCA